MKSATLALLLLFFCAPALADDAPLRVITTFSVLADIAKNIGGDTISVTSLVGTNADTHAFQPTPEDAKKLANADMIIANGLGFEGWLQRLIMASGTHAKLVIVSRGLDSRLLRAPNGTPDPHLWQDLTNGRAYAHNIADALVEALPDKKAAIRQREAAYDAALLKEDQEIRTSFEPISEARRKIITNHDAFAYFGAAYGVTFLSPVGINTEAEPAAAGMAKLLTQIRSEGVREIFIENMSNPRLLEQIARDSGTKIGGTLYSDALSPPGGPAPTYIGMFKHNADLFREAMLHNQL